MFKRLQPFGYADPERSLYHDTQEVLKEVSAQFRVIPPVAQGNRTPAQVRSDIAHLFWKIYQEKYINRSVCARRQVIRDAEEFAQTGIMPYYVMRIWYGRRFGENQVAEHLRLGLRGTDPIVAPAAAS